MNGAKELGRGVGNLYNHSFYSYGWQEAFIALTTSLEAKT